MNSKLNRIWRNKLWRIQAQSVAMNRGVPIIGSAKISAIDMAIFTNIDIGTEQ